MTARCVLLIVFAMVACMPRPYSSAAPAPAPPLELQHFTLAQLQAPGKADFIRLRAAIFEVGLFAVTDFDGPNHQPEDEPFSGALHAYALCAQAGQLGNHLLEVKLSDQTLRSTFATATNGSVAQQLPEDARRNCPAFASAASDLRQSVDTAGQAYARVLDRIVHGISATDSVRSKGDSFVSAAVRAESLEHFHLFQRRSASAGQASLDMHSDMGLFLVMTAAEYFSSAGDGARLEPGKGKPEAGLLLELPGGKVVRPVFADGSLLVMNGEGSTLWVRADGPQASTRRPYAPPHELQVPDVEGSARAWFGRMYLPPRDAMLQVGPSKGMTFNEFRQQTYAAFHEGRPCEASQEGCPTQRRSLSDEGSCSAGEVYCWMQCMPPTGLNCSREATICTNAKGQMWPQDFIVGGTTQHCFECSLQCPNAPPLPASTGFCNTRLNPITMWMTGFQFSGSSEDACVAYLFQQWTLDTRVKFAFACIGTFFMGIVVMLLGFIRRRVWKAHDATGPSVSHLRSAGMLTVIMTAFTVQLALAYFLMLFVMTYQAELFIMTVLGLVVGHFLFEIYARWGVESDGVSSSSGSGVIIDMGPSDHKKGIVFAHKEVAIF